MTVAATTNRKTYTGDNVSTSFATSPVIFYLSSNLQVRITVIATGVSTLLTENTHYTVSGGGAAGLVGTISLAGGSSPHGALLSTEKLVILRVLPLTQASDFVNNNNSDAEVLESALDKLTDVDQQLSERQDRALTFAEGDVSGSTTTIQDASVRAGRLLGFDALGVLTTLAVQIGTSIVDLAASTGSSLIGHVQAGVGAIARTLQSILRERISAFDFMTAAQIADVQARTQLVNVTAALQAAINAAVASSKSLFIPAGIYLITSALNITGSVKIYGESRDASVIGGSNCSGFTYATGITGIHIENLTVQTFPFYSNGTTNAFAGISVTDSTLQSFAHIYKNLRIRGYGTAVIANKFINAVFDSVQILDSHIGIQVDNGKNSHLVYITNCDIELGTGTTFSANSWGLNLQGHCEGWHLVNTLIYNADVGIFAVGCSSMRLDNCEFDFIGTQGIYAVDAGGATNNDDWSICNSYFALSGAGGLVGIHISMDAAPAQNYGNRIIGNHFRKYAGATASYGVWLQGATCSYNIIAGNTMAGMSTFDIYDQTTGAAAGTSLIAGNKCLSALTPAISSTGFISDPTFGALRSSVPNTQTGATYTVLPADTSIIANRAGTVTLTLEGAATCPGKIIMVRTIQAQTVVSASTNVVPRAGGAAGTAILAAAAGNWALLQSDGTNWQIMAGS